MTCYRSVPGAVPGHAGTRWEADVLPGARDRTVQRRGTSGSLELLSHRQR